MSTAYEDQTLDAVLKSTLKQVGVTNQAEIDELVNDSLQRWLSLRSVGVAIAKLPTVPAGFTRAVQATENAWRRIADEQGGLLSSTEVAVRIGSKSPHRNMASDLRRSGKIIGVQRLNSYVYPGFQFAADGAIKPVVPKLLQVAKEAGWSEANLVMWLCSESTRFSRGRPVDHLDDDGFIETVREIAQTDW